MRRIPPCIIVLRRDMKNLQWIRDHYDIEGHPESTYSGLVTVPTGLGSNEDSEFALTVTSDMFPHATVIVSPPEPEDGKF